MIHIFVQYPVLLNMSSPLHRILKYNKSSQRNANEQDKQNHNLPSRFFNNIKT